MNSRTPAHVAMITASLLVIGTSPLASQSSPRPLTDTITAVASRTPLGNAARVVDVIGREAIARSSARNVAELLAFQLGVDVYGRSAAQADISLRGSTAEQTLVLVDGVRVSDAQSSHYAMDLAVPLNDIERVEILRGGGSALYGPDAIGGVINIVTRRGGSSVLAAHGGAFGTVGGNGAGALRMGSVTITSAAEYEKSDGFRIGAEHKIGQGRVSLAAPVGAGTLTTNVGLGIRDFGANTFYGPYNSIERTGAYTADARWVAPIGSWALSTTLGTRKHTDHFTLVRENPSLYQNDHTSWQHSGEVVARTAISNVSIALGADAENATLRSARLGNHDEWREAGFAEATIDAHSIASINFGLRADHSSIYGGFLSPSLALAHSVSHAARLHASVNRGFRAPTWTERYYVDPANQGNADLAPERFWSGDAGLRLGHPGSTMVDVTGFARNAKQLIDWVKPANSPVGTKWVATNVGDATYRGIEGTITLPTWHRLSGSLTGTALSFTDDQGAGLSGKYALRPITRQFTAHVRYAASRSVIASIEMLSARRASEGAYVTGNARLEWRHDAIAVTVDLTNVTDARWIDASGMDVAGRAIYVGMRWVGRR